MSNVFCGIGKLPKGKKLGSMKDCVEHGQVRYYGLKKIDERLIESMSKKGSKKLNSSSTDLKTQIQKLTIDLISIRGKIKNIEKKIIKEKDDKKKKQLEKDIKTLSEKSKKIRSDIDKLEKQHTSKQKRLTKRLTKKSTKKSTKKK